MGYSADSNRGGRGRAIATQAVLVTICMFALSGCFLQSVLGHVREDGGAAFGMSVEVGFCDYGTDPSFPEFYGCNYNFYNEDGFILDLTSTFALTSEFGFLGLIIDPLVLQVPSDVTSVVATYNLSGSDEPLVVTETTSFMATPDTEVTAETGTKFLIFELPDSAVSTLPTDTMTGVDFDIEFDTPNPAFLDVKPLMTGRVDQGGQTYYVPIFPCTTDFSTIPASRVPVSSTLQDLRPTYSTLTDNAAALACDNVTYDFSGATGTLLCAGLPVTIDMNTNGGVGTGTAGDDVIMGTPNADTIDAGDGNDTVCAGDGDDTVNGGPGNDLLIGDAGNDQLHGQAGNDVARGNTGDDHVSGGSGNDRVLGGIGNDELVGGDGDDYIGGFGGDDVIRGGPGNEIIFGGFGADTIDGGPGDDVIRGLIGNDIIDGGSGNDTLDGDRGSDTIRGGTGADVIRGGNADDSLFGDGGDDSVSGGRADDVLSGGFGIDVCVGNDQFVADTTDGSCETVFGVP